MTITLAEPRAAHSVSGRTHLAPIGCTLAEHKRSVQARYGTLRGVRLRELPAGTVLMRVGGAGGFWKVIEAHNLRSNDNARKRSTIKTVGYQYNGRPA